MQRKVFRSKPAGLEYFVRESEIGHLDNLQVWNLKGSTSDTWASTLAAIRMDKRAFISSENPDFSPD